MNCGNPYSSLTLISSHGNIKQAIYTNQSSMRIGGLRRGRIASWTNCVVDEFQKYKLRRGPIASWTNCVMDQFLMDKLLMDELRHDQLLMDESHHPPLDSHSIGSGIFKNDPMNVIACPVVTTSVNGQGQIRAQQGQNRAQQGLNQAQHGQNRAQQGQNRAQ
jgi:hypothetical protein